MLTLPTLRDTLPLDTWLGYESPRRSELTRSGAAKPGLWNSGTRNTIPDFLFTCSFGALPLFHKPASISNNQHSGIPSMCAVCHTRLLKFRIDDAFPVTPATHSIVNIKRINVAGTIIDT